MGAVLSLLFSIGGISVLGAMVFLGYLQTANETPEASAAPVVEAPSADQTLTDDDFTYLGLMLLDENQTYGEQELIDAMVRSAGLRGFEEKENYANAYEAAMTQKRTEYLEAFRTGTLKPVDYYVNYYVYTDESLRPFLNDYVEFCLTYSKWIFNVGLFNTNNPLAEKLNWDLGRFAEGHRYYTAETRAILEQIKDEDPGTDDITTAYAVVHSKPLRQLFHDRGRLISKIQANQGFYSERADYAENGIDPNANLEDFHSIDLIKIYLLQKALIDDAVLRDRIIAILAQDIRRGFRTSEIGGGIRLDPDTLTFEVIPVEMDLTQGSDVAFSPKNRAVHYRVSTFASFHNHADTSWEARYAGPSGPDIISSFNSFCSADIELTSMTPGAFNVHYYRSVGPQSSDDHSWNLGAFVANGQLLPVP